MLQHIREKFTGTFALVILALIGIPFVFFGINYDFTGSSFAAKVDGEEISAAFFEQQYRSELAQRPEFADLNAAQRQQLRRSLLDRLVREQLVRNYLVENRYRIGDKQLTDLIQQEQSFQVDGQFFSEAYDRSWYSYDVSARDIQLSNYQFRAPSDWFAEFYASFYLGLVDGSHPFYDTFVKVVHENTEMRPAA